MREGEQHAEHAERGQQLGTADDARHGFGVDGVDGEERRRGGGGEDRRQHAQSQEEDRERNHHVQCDVDQVIAERGAAHAGVGGVGQHGERPVERAGRVHVVEQRTGRRHLHRRVVANQIVVVEGEVGRERIQIRQHREDGDQHRDPRRAA